MKKQWNQWGLERPFLKFDLKMKLTTLLLISTFFGLYANDSYAQKTKISLDLDNVSVRNVIDDLESTTDFLFVYKIKDVDLKRKVSLKAKKENIETILKSLFQNTNTSYKIRGTQIILRERQDSFSEVSKQIPTEDSSKDKVRVNGTVFDQNGQPLPGANILEKGTTNGTQSDFDGKFSIDIIDQDAILVISYIGYQTKEVAVTSSTLTITLQVNVNVMDEVVVTALGIKREEKALGYAVQKVDGEVLQKVSGVDVATSLTGKVAGLLVRNPSDFNVTPTITIRGEEPLLVIDGVAYANKTLNDISSEDIESMSVLKGATASALYGFRGANGAILITTKNGSTYESGVTVDLTTNTMFSAGYLAIPEKQSVYGRGTANTYDINADQSWGTAMDGSIQTQWDPYLKEFRDYEYLPVGKDNFMNFLEQGYITNNNLNVAFKGDKVALRSSINWTENKGRYPNSKLDKYTYTFGGDIDMDKFQLTSNLSYSKRESPNMGSNGYTSYDPMYTLLIWGPSDYNVLDYKNNYWIIPGELQNNQYGVYPDGSYKGKNQNSPYFDRYEKTNEVSRDIFNADLSSSYEVTDWLKATVRSGLDFYVDRGQIRVSQGSYVSTGNTGIPGNASTWNGTKTGAYITGKTQGFSINSDLLFTGNKTFDKFDIDYLVGGTIFYQRNDNINAQTVGGISTPGFFSLNASVDPAKVGETSLTQQVNSAFGRLSLSWNDLIYLEATGRNDWSSTLAGPGIPNSDMSYFYPSVAGSFVISQMLSDSTREWVDLLKIRNSWTQSKTPAGIYDIIPVFSVVPGTWNDLNGATAPNALYSSNVKPNTSSTLEIGVQGIMFKNRLGIDVSYYEKNMYDILKADPPAPISAASGYTGKVINTDEEISRRGWEIAATVSPIKKEDLQLDLAFNWSTYKDLYTRLDPVYSTQKPWIKVGSRVDAYVGKDFLKVPETGEIIYENGRIKKSSYDSVFGYKNPDWFWGVNTTLRYKDFSLFLSMDGVVGGLMNTRTESYMWQSGGHPDSVTEARALDVADPGSKNYIGDGVKIVSGTVAFDTNGNIISDDRIYATNDVATTYSRAAIDLHNSSAWGGTGTITDAYENTFLKLREVSLTYNIPSKLLNSWGPVKRASISFVGQNVLLWAKDFKYSDPDGGKEDFADPSVRYLGGNIKLTF